MAVLFWVIVALILLLTGAIVPILIFGGWALVVILTIVLLVWVTARFFGFLLKPIGWLFTDLAGAVGPKKFPNPGEPDYGAYIDWANRTGEFGSYDSWEAVKAQLENRRQSDYERAKWEQKTQRDTQ